MRIKNFLFHRVSEDQDLLWPPMNPGLFTRIIRHLVTNYNVVNLEDYLENQKTFIRSKKPLATVLFDDGYKDNIEYAAPILDRFSCPASFYVVTDCIDRNIATWTYIVDFILQNTTDRELKLNLDFVPDQFRMLSPGSMERKNVKPWMKSLPNDQRISVLEILRQSSGVELPGNMMSWDDVCQLIQGGFTVGSHSHTHPMLAKIENEDDIKTELSVSFNRLKEKTNTIPLTISYPIGSFDERVQNISREVGYRYGLAVEQEFYDTDIHSQMSIPRVELYQEPWWKVAARINGIYNRIKRWV